MSGRRDNTARRNSLDLAPTPYMTRQAGAYTPPDPPTDVARILEDNTPRLLEDGSPRYLEAA